MVNFWSFLKFFEKFCIKTWNICEKFGFLSFSGQKVEKMVDFWQKMSIFRLQNIAKNGHYLSKIDHFFHFQTQKWQKSEFFENISSFYTKFMRNFSKNFKNDQKWAIFDQKITKNRIFWQFWDNFRYFYCILTTFYKVIHKIWRKIF